MTREERFWSKVDVRAQHECWPWRRKLGPGGYGSFYWGDENGVRTGMIRANRVAFMLTYGPVPRALDTCHSCDNRACCNPEHLSIGSRRENLNDMSQKRRHFAHVHPELACKLASEERSLIRQSTLPGNMLAQYYGVSEALISMIRSGKR